MTITGNIFLHAVIIVFGLAAIVQLFYYLYFYLSLQKSVSSENVARVKAPVSVIICSRNEENNLRAFLPAVLMQDYPDYEVIVVNDCSEDNSYDVLGEYLNKYPRLRVSNISKDPKFTHNKRFAQFIGIKAAKNEIMLLTDADCQPESDKWIEHMTSHFDESTEFVLGYGGYYSADGLLNKYIRYDTMTIAMQYLGMAIRGIPYMGVGRNLAYRRSLFFSKKGFGPHNQLVSGDDDLFVNVNATGRNTQTEFRKEAHTRSVPASELKEWIKQKKRHLTTAGFYKLKDKILLISEPVSRVLFYTCFAVLLPSLFLWPVVLAIFGIRLIVQIMVFNIVQKKLNEQGLLAFSIIFDIFSPFINAILYAGNFRTSPDRNRWKQ